MVYMSRPSISMKKYIASFLAVLVLSAGLFAYHIETAQASTTVTFTTSGSFTVPAGVTSLQVNAWAAGGGGFKHSGGATNGKGSGGGGGAFSALNTFAVTPEQTITYTVGIAGITGTGATAGGDSMFSASSTLLAKGGSPGADTTGGAGGPASSGVGDVTHSGGTGGAESGSTGGGGGGGAAGTTADGGTGGVNSGCTGGTAGTGGASSGGNGGHGGDTGTNATAPGGGGAGGSSGNVCNATAGAAAAGEIDITYTVNTSPHAGVLFISGKTTLTQGTIIIP